MLSDDDWVVITQYLELLKPFKIATKRLEGRIREGKGGSLWEVLPTFEVLLKHLETAKVQYANYPESHFKNNINLAWTKLLEYYQLTDRTPAYITALVLVPWHKWKWAELHWTPEWIVPAQAAVKNLWETRYKHLEINQQHGGQQHGGQPQVARQPEVSAHGNDDFYSNSFRSSLTPGTPAPGDEYTRWLARDAHDDDMEATDPIEYWKLKLTGSQFPRLARMALDHMSAPAMSTSNERDFNKTKSMWEGRSALFADVVSGCIALASWDKEGLIDMLDEGLVRGNHKRRRADTVELEPVNVLDTVESGANEEAGDTEEDGSLYG